MARVTIRGHLMADSVAGGVGLFHWGVVVIARQQVVLADIRLR